MTISTHSSLVIRQIQLFADILVVIMAAMYQQTVEFVKMVVPRQLCQTIRPLTSHSQEILALNNWKGHQMQTHLDDKQEDMGIGLVVGRLNVFLACLLIPISSVT